MDTTNVAAGLPDVAVIAAAFADPRRVRILLALADGRALPAGRLAQEAGVAPSTAAHHLAHLQALHLLGVETHGRHRYYRLATPHVEAILQALALLAPSEPITSLRESTRAHALRAGRTCYGHLAGRLGVDLFGGLIAAGWVVGGDGHHRPGCDADRLSAPGKSDRYRFTEQGTIALRGWGLPRRLAHTDVTVRYCVDWTEQAHHLAGAQGTALRTHLLERGWITGGAAPRTVKMTPAGQRHLRDLFPTADPSQGRP